MLNTGKLGGGGVLKNKLVGCSLEDVLDSSGGHFIQVCSRGRNGAKRWVINYNLLLCFKKKKRGVSPAKVHGALPYLAFR